MLSSPGIPASQPHHASSASNYQEARNPARTWLPDPIVADEHDVHLVQTDDIPRLSAKDRANLWAEKTFVHLPKAVVNGLKGEQSYNFSDFLQVAKIPYYLGGTFLTLSFLAGKDKVNGIRQGLGVLLYYLGMGGSNTLINKLTEWRTGVDLTLPYRTADGKLDKVFASADFPRLDLLEKEDYEKIKEKLDIPDHVADPVSEANQQIKEVISAARANKLIVGNLLAAVGAGYIARSDGWAHLLGAKRELKNTLVDKSAGSLPTRVRNTGIALGSLLESGFKEKFTGALSGPAKKIRVGAVATLLSAIGYGLVQSLRPVSNKNYEKPANSSPQFQGVGSRYQTIFQPSRVGVSGGKLR